jgi:protein N-terminal methyltransferase
LLSLAEKVDIVEPIKKFTDALKDVPGVGEVYNVGLELWKPASGAVYDLVWNQWCLGHLTDLQLVAYLRRCGEALRREEGGKVVGWIVVKENLTSEEDVYDETDSSVTRYVYFPLYGVIRRRCIFVDGSESAKLTRIIGRKGNSKSYLRKQG